ncbi:hypothetical protein EPN96_04765 [bacterium]|nr:MAG: hypothetical protein EPN96_04765 [bacterium]
MALLPILRLEKRRSLALLLLLTAAPCAAAPLYPFSALAPMPMEGGEINLRLGASYFHRDHLIFDDEDRNRKVAELPSIRSVIAVAPNSEIHLSYPLLYLEQEGQSSEYGSGDATISGLFTPLGTDARNVALGLKLAVKLPNADDEKGFGTDETDFSIGLAAAKKAGSFLTVVNADFAILGEPHSAATNQDDVLVYNLVGIYDFGGGVNAGLGIDGLNYSKYGNNRLSASAGLSFPWRVVGIDLGFGLGLAGKAPDWTATVGMSFQFNAPVNVRSPGQCREP